MTQSRRLLVGMILVGLLLPLAWPRAFAQEEDTGVIYGYQAEMLFPAVVRFFVSLSVPLEQITAVSLTLHQESGWERSVPVNPAESLASGTDRASELVYVWDLLGEDAPRLLEPGSFTWRVETADGQVSTSDDAFMVVDAGRGEWKSAGEPPLVLHWHNADLGGGLIQDEMLVAYDLLDRRMSDAPDFTFAIYDPAESLCQETLDPESGDPISVVISSRDGAAYPCSRDAFESLYRQSGIAFVQRPSYGYADLRDLLIRRMVADSYHAMWTAPPAPDWFLAGLAQLYQQRPGSAALALARSAARSESLFDLSALQTHPPSDASYQERALWDAESYLLALYLADRFGASVPFDLAASMGSQDFATALRAHTGLSEAQVWSEFTRWLFLEAADRAILWTPYLSTTPTPTPTATQTPVPPTATATATPTLTPTATSTYLAEQARTAVRMTVPPTQAQRPTNTALPPGSLHTATQVEPESTAAARDDAGADLAPAAIIAAVAVILVLGLLAVIARGRRPR